MPKDFELHDEYKDVIDLIEGDKKEALTNHRSTIAEQLLKIPKYNENNKFGNLDDLVHFINKNDKSNNDKKKKKKVNKKAKNGTATTTSISNSNTDTSTPVTSKILGSNKNINTKTTSTPQVPVQHPNSNSNSNSNININLNINNPIPLLKSNSSNSSYRSPEDPEVDKFKKLLDNQSIHRHIVVKIQNNQINLNKDWINSINSK